MVRGRSDPVPLNRFDLFVSSFTGGARLTKLEPMVSYDFLVRPVPDFYGWSFEIKVEVSCDRGQPPLVTVEFPGRKEATFTDSLVNFSPPSIPDDLDFACFHAISFPTNLLDKYSKELFGCQGLGSDLRERM
jgi:hypothetical protein